MLRRFGKCLLFCSKWSAGYISAQTMGVEKNRYSLTSFGNAFYNDGVDSKFSANLLLQYAHYKMSKSNKSPWNPLNSLLSERKRNCLIKCHAFGLWVCAGAVITHSDGVTPGALVPLTQPWGELMLKSPGRAVRTEHRNSLSTSLCCAGPSNAFPGPTARSHSLGLTGSHQCPGSLAGRFVIVLVGVSSSASGRGTHWCW